MTTLFTVYYDEHKPAFEVCQKNLQMVVDSLFWLMFVLPTFHQAQLAEQPK